MPTPEDPPTRHPMAVLPAWMEQYRDLIAETGGNEIEDLLQDLHTDNRLTRTNLPRAILAFMVNAQVGLLTRLHKKDLLANTPEVILGGGEIRTDDGPTPQQEIDWAIHNDHADDVQDGE